MTDPTSPLSSWTYVWVFAFDYGFDGTPTKGEYLFNPRVSQLVNFRDAARNPTLARIMRGASFRARVGSPDQVPFPASVPPGFMATRIPATNDPDNSVINFTVQVTAPDGKTTVDMVVPYDTPVLNQPDGFGPDGSLPHPLHGEQAINLYTVFPGGTPSGGAVQLVAGPPGPPGASTTFTQTATKTAAYTAAANEIVVAKTTGGTFPVTGPASGAPFGVRWKEGTAPPTVLAPAGYTINGAASLALGLLPGSSAGELVIWQAFGTDYQSVGSSKPQSALDLRHGAILNTHLLAWAYAQAFRLVSATRNADEAITTASVVWPDGSTGVFTTTTASTAFPGAIDAYTVTYVPAVGPTKTVTQPAVTRDAAGAVTAQPAVTVA